MNYKQLTLEERYAIAGWREAGLMMDRIAFELNTRPGKRLNFISPLRGIGSGESIALTY